MKQNTFVDYGKEPPYEMTVVTTIDTVCPCCHARIRFMPPNDIGLLSHEKENEYLRKELMHMYERVRFAEQLLKRNMGL